MGPAQRDPSRLRPGIKLPERCKIWTPDAGDWAAVDKYDAETNGQYTKWTVSLAPSQCLSLARIIFGDVHRQQGWSIYYALAGRVTLQPGDSRTAPGGEVHDSFNPGTEEVELKMVLRPSVERFEKGLYILCGLERDWMTHGGGIPNNLIHRLIDPSCPLSIDVLTTLEGHWIMHIYNHSVNVAM